MWLINHQCASKMWSISVINIVIDGGKLFQICNSEGKHYKFINLQI